MPTEAQYEFDQDTLPEPLPQNPPVPQNVQAQPEAEGEVSFQEAVDEQQRPGGVSNRNAEAAEKEDVIDILQPKSAPRTWDIGPENMRRTYIQRPLGFLAKMQFFSLVGEALDKALSGPNKMSLGGLLSAPGGRGSALSMDDFRDADTFVQAISKLLAAAPDFLVDSYCLWLGVPDYEQEVVKELMKLPPDDGGLTDDQGLEMIEVFIDQNYDALNSFFTERLGGLQKRFQAAQARRARK